MKKARNPQKPSPPSLDLLSLGKSEGEREITVGGRTARVYLRTVGSADALWRAARDAYDRELVRLHRDEELMEAVRLKVSWLPTEELASQVLERERPRREERALTGMPDPLCTRDAGESDDSWAGRRAKHEDTCTKRAEERREEVERLETGRKAELLAMDAGPFLELALPIELEAQARMTMLRSWQDRLLYEATFRPDDPARRYFDSPQQLAQLGEPVRTALLEAYDALDAGGLGGLLGAGEETLPNASANARTGGSTT